MVYLPEYSIWSVLQDKVYYYSKISMNSKHVWSMSERSLTNQSLCRYQPVAPSVLLSVYARHTHFEHKILTILNRSIIRTYNYSFPGPAVALTGPTPLYEVEKWKLYLNSPPVHENVTQMSPLSHVHVLVVGCWHDIQWSHLRACDDGFNTDSITSISSRDVIIFIFTHHKHIITYIYPGFKAICDKPDLLKLNEF